MKKASLKKLPNGLTIISVPSKSPSVTVSVFVSTGSRYETKNNNGISHFLEHLCFKGTSQRKGKDIMRYLDGLGAETNAFTNQELTGYYVKSTTKHWKKTLAIVADIYLHSSFPDAEMQKEKGVIVGEIDMYEDMPTSQVHDLMMSLVYGDQPTGWPIIGTKENIYEMTREDILAYHQDHYVAEATTIVIAGDVDRKEAELEARHFFKNIPDRKKPKALRSKKLKTQDVKLRVRDTDQTHMIMAYPSCGYNHQDALAMMLLGIILGGGMSSRLFETLREDMGVGYYVNAFNGTLFDTGVFQISTGIDSSRVEEVVVAILKELDTLKKDGLEEKELRKSKEYFIGNYLMSLEATDDLGYFYGRRSSFSLPLKSPQEIVREVKKISSKDIMRVARRVLRHEKLKIALVGPHSAALEKKLTNLIKKQ